MDHLSSKMLAFFHVILILSGSKLLLTGVLSEIIEIKGPTFLNELPDVLDFSNGTGARLDCLVRGMPTPNVQWIRMDGSPVVSVGHLLNVMTNGSLLFMPFGAEHYRQDIHASLYKCVATNAAGAILSKNVKVRGVVKQFYEVQVYDEFVILGNTAMLKCHVPSFVRDHVQVTSWIQDDSTIMTRSYGGGNGRITVSATGELHIRVVNRKDASKKYRCKTIHRLTGDTRLSPPGQLIVTDPQSSVPPRITHSLPMVQGKQSETLELFCVAQAYPVPTYRWYKLIDKQIVSFDGSNGRIRQQNNMLVIQESTVDDGGLYACVVNNSVGEERVETIVVITAQLNVKVQPQHQVGNIGGTAMLNCVISGHPVHSVSWVKDGRPVLPSRKYEFLSKEILKINNISREDRGMYQCFVSNEESMTEGVAELVLGDAVPDFSETFSEMTIKQSSNFALRCVVSSNPPVQITWQLDDMELTTNRRRYDVITFTGIGGDIVSSLNVSDARVEDGGIYSCTATNRIGNVTNSARVNVWGPPYIRPMENTTVIAGENVVLKCPVTGYPIESITWERDNRVLPINLRQNALPNGTLILDSTEKSDAGFYACTARNQLGQRDKKTTWLSVIVPPRIEPFGFPRETREGLRARLLCSVVDGDSPIRITWLKDDQPVPTDDQDVVIQKTDEFSSLMTFKAVTLKQNGNYTCVASNSAGKVVHTAELQVQVPPYWMTEPKDEEVLLAKTATLDCKAGGFPLPNLQWMKSKGKAPGSFLDLRGYGSRHRLFPNGSFTVNNAQKTDEGYYLCQATNGIGSGQSKVVFLKVNVPAHFQTKTYNASVRVNEDGILTCEATGDKPMEIRWSRNGRRIGHESNDRFTVKYHELDDGLLSELSLHRAIRDDAAVFQCYATNAYGHDEATVRLAVQEQPEQPTNLFVLNVSGRNATLSWNVPFNGNDPITGYIIQYKKITDSWEEKSFNSTIHGMDSTATIYSLAPGTPYHVRVFALNTMGISTPSVAIDLTTIEEEPGGSPLAIEAKATSSESVKITWKPPKRDYWNGIILGYYVGYRIYDSNESYKYKTVDINPTSDTMEYHLTHLKKYTKYSIVVNAFNRMGKGPASDEVIAVTSEDAPDEPPQEVTCVPLSSQSVQVNWSPPLVSAQNGQILGYKVFYRLVSDWEDAEELHVTATSVLKVNLHTLQKYSNYSVQLLAFTRVGAGVRSLPVFCRTQEDVPGPPESIKALVMTSDSILVTWLRPQHNNGNLIKYTLYMRSSNDRQPHTVKHISSTLYDLSYEARGLKEKEIYEFWITASTVIGEGESTKVIKQSPQSKVVAQIASFSNQIKFKWKEVATLPCRAVGLPTPIRRWSFRGGAITEGGRMLIRPDGSLQIKDLIHSDLGNYTCDVENIYGRDSITYMLIVQAPPVSPSVAVVATTLTSLQLKVLPPKEVRGIVKGYTLTYKRDFSEWEEINIDKDDEIITLENLRCGTMYHLYMTAYNRVGAGEASNIVPVSTKGAAPKVKKVDEVVTTNVTFVTVHLRHWPDGGCPITYYVLKYKQVEEKEWLLVSNKIQPQQGDFIVSDLSPGTWYSIELTAHNAAGFAMAQYTVATLTADGVTIAPNTAPNTAQRGGPLALNWNLIAPVAAAIAIVVLMMVLGICLLLRQRKYRGYHNSYIATDINTKMALNPHLKPSCGNTTHSIELTLTPTPGRRKSRELGQQRGSDDITSPYALFKLPQHHCKDTSIVSSAAMENHHQQINENHMSEPANDVRTRRRLTHLTNLSNDEHGTTIINELERCTSLSPSDAFHGLDECTHQVQTGHVLIYRAEYDSVISDSDNSDMGGEYYTESAAQLHHDRCRGNLPDLLFHGTDTSSSSTDNVETSPDEEDDDEEDEDNGNDNRRMTQLSRASLHKDSLINRYSSGTQDITTYLQETHPNSLNYSDTNEMSEAECDRDLARWRSRHEQQLPPPFNSNHNRLSGRLSASVSSATLIKTNEVKAHHHHHHHQQQQQQHITEGECCNGCIIRV